MRHIAALTAVLISLGSVTLVGCQAGSSQDAGTVVVSTDHQFSSLNAATAAGRTPGSTLVRGLVQSRLTNMDDNGGTTVNTQMGTVEKLSDDPLTVRYTLASTAVWSDGVPVTPADLLLEWAARSGQFDEVVPAVDGDGEVVDIDPDKLVSFAAASAALVQVPAVPTVDGQSLTLVYETPAADWQHALDVNLPAHVVGELALADGLNVDASSTSNPSTDSPSTGASNANSPSADSSAGDSSSAATSSASTAASASAPSATSASVAASEPDRWAREVSAAIVNADRAALVQISQVWRDLGERDQLVEHPEWAVTTGPYRITELTASTVVMEPNPEYLGSDPGTTPHVVVRSDLDPLAQIEAVQTGEVDVALPIDAVDVRAAAADADLGLRTGAGATMQLIVNEYDGSPFDPKDLAAAERRKRFIQAASMPQVVDAVDNPPSQVILAQFGSRWAAAAAPSSAPAATAAAAVGEPVTVRLLVDVNDPVRAALVKALQTAAEPAGFVVTVVDGDFPTALWVQPQTWDAVLMPVVQDQLPVAAVAARWDSNGVTNVTHHQDPSLDSLLDAALVQVDPEKQAETLADLHESLQQADVVLPLVQQTSLAVVAGGGPSPSAVPWASSDLSAWWSWLD